MVDYARQTLDRAEREKARLMAQLEVATTALQAASTSCRPRSRSTTTASRRSTGCACT